MAKRKNILEKACDNITSDLEKRTCGCPRNRVPTQAWESIDDTDADDPGIELDEDGYPIGDFEDCEG